MKSQKVLELVEWPVSVDHIRKVEVARISTGLWLVNLHYVQKRIGKRNFRAIWR